MPNIDHLNLGEWRIGEMWAFILQSLDGVVVGTFTFHVGDSGSIPPLDQQTFTFSFYPSHHQTFLFKTSNLRNHPPFSHNSYKRASIKP